MKMRLLIFMIFSCCVLCAVYAKGSGVRALTESMGQEVIEIGGQLKELPQDLEEEPSAEADDDEDDKMDKMDKMDKATTSPRLPAATKKETAKTVASPPPETRRKVKDVDRIDPSLDDDESRIEKEIAEIYKDNDYKSDSSEVSKANRSSRLSTNPRTGAVREKTSETLKGDSRELDEPIANNSIEESKPIARARTNFKFQPDPNEDVERWRTSVDDIACVKNKKLTGEVSEESSACCMNLPTKEYLHCALCLSKFHLECPKKVSRKKCKTAAGAAAKSCKDQPTKELQADCEECKSLYHLNEHTTGSAIRSSLNVFVMLLMSLLF